MRGCHAPSCWEGLVLLVALWIAALLTGVRQLWLACLILLIALLAVSGWQVGIRDSR
ncbi:MAG: hypothetical protein KDA21_05260 [Phycisphaerales bacterium]|nr:hypothetical protein [Phycisphaerales bacterium]